MAIATGLAIAAGVTAAAGAAKAIDGGVRASKAKKALEKFQRQELRNITEGMRVSTLGAQLQTQEAQRRFATSVDALRSGGVRGVVGGLGQQEQLQQRQQQQISADLDRQQQQIEMMRAQDEARIRSMTEERQAFDYQQLVGERAAGREALMSGITDVAGAASTALMGMESMQAGEPRLKGLTTLQDFGGKITTTNSILGSAEYGTRNKGLLGLGGQESYLKGYQMDTFDLSDPSGSLKRSVSGITIPKYPK